VTLQSFAALLGLLVLLVLYRFTQPVLYYIPADCNCTSYSDRVEGYVVLNPYRNLAPERAADKVLEDARDGRISPLAAPELATRLASDREHFSKLGWKLAFREDSWDGATLYYKLDPTGGKMNIDVDHGYGYMNMVTEPGSWKAEDFGASY
jgi:hypothetical protein